MNWYPYTSVKLLALILAASCQTVSPTTEKIPSPLNLPLHERIERIVQNYDARTKVGIQIISMTKGKTLYERNAEHLFTPASTLKLYTAAAALYYLGPSFRFETKVFTDRSEKKGIHNLYIQGSGDPSFSANDVAKIARDLKQFGIHTISGDIVVDDHQFDDVKWGKGWMWDDMHKGFSAPISAINVDYNRIVVFAKPSNKVGDALRITLEPFTHFVKIVNHATTSSANSKNDLHISLTPAEPKDSDASQPILGLTPNQTIYIRGSLPQNETFDYKTFSINDPSYFAAYLLKEQLALQGIHVKGNPRRGETPLNAFPLVNIVSRSLSESIVDFVKISNNQATEVLLKTMGLKVAGTPGTFQAGILATQKFLREQVKITSTGLINADGSGLSRYSLTSPAQMTQLLDYMWHNFNIGPEFVAALPIAGEDGTLNGRLQDSMLRGRVRAKTGSMANVCSLVGYLFNNDGDTLAFAIMVNGHVSTRSSCRKIVDDVLTTTSHGGPY